MYDSNRVPFPPLPPPMRLRADLQQIESLFTPHQEPGTHVPSDASEPVNHERVFRYR